MDGSCNLEGVGAFSEVLSEIASYGFITVVVGNPTSSGSEALSTDPKSMLKPLDWLYTENERPCSKYYHKILKNKAAASGQSCGGVHALGAGKDPRVATVVPMNSGLTLLRHYPKGANLGDARERARWQNGQRGSQAAIARAMASRTVMKLSSKCRSGRDGVRVARSFPGGRGGEMPRTFGNDERVAA
jgi:hypothetical protein